MRSSDVIGRTAGNKFGVILQELQEREVAIVAERLRAAVRGNVVDTRCGQVAATCSVGAVWLPSGASPSQEAMLRAEEALDARAAAAATASPSMQQSPQRESARLRHDGDRRRSGGRAQETTA